MTEKEERLDEELAKTAEETAETPESSNESTETEAQTPQPEEEAVEKANWNFCKKRITNWKINSCVLVQRSQISLHVTAMSGNFYKNTARKILAKNCCQQSTIWNERWQQMSIKTKRRI